MNGKPGKTVPTGFGDVAATPVIDAVRCTNCGLCVKVCSSETIVELDGRATVVPDNGMGCFACGHCMAACAFGAVSVTGRRMSPDDVVPWPAADRTATAEQLHNLMLTRRSIRKFQDRPLERELVDRIIEMTATAPMGIAPSDVEVTVVLGRENVDRLAGDIDGVFRKWRSFFNPVTMFFMKLFSSKANYESMKGFVVPIVNEMIHGREHGNDMLFYSAPCVLVFHVNPMADPVDGTIACTYAMLAAQSLGLGTCMIGTAPHAMDRDANLKRKWGIPAGNKVALTMLVGYPANRYHNVIRRTMADVRFPSA